MLACNLRHRQSMAFVFVTTPGKTLGPPGPGGLCKRRISRMFKMSATDIGTGRELVRPPSLAPNSKPFSPLTEEQVEHFFREGYVVARSLLPESQIAAMCEAADQLDGSRKGTPQPLYDELVIGGSLAGSAFRSQVALRAPLADAVRQLVEASSGDRGIVLLKDAFFRLRGRNKGCGFHVDDSFFWPCPRDAPGPGVNAWIPLDPVRGAGGGGMAIAPRSHTEEYLDVREAILPSTCTLSEMAPPLNERLEAIAEKPAFEVGDVLLCTRFLFHRGEGFGADEDEEVVENGVRRYTVRYMPGNAEVRPIGLSPEGKFVAEEPFLLSDGDELQYPGLFN